MKWVFDLAAERHDAIIKQAFLGTMLGAAGRFIAKNPLKTLGGVLTGQQVMADSKKMVNAAGRSVADNIPSPPPATF